MLDYRQLATMDLPFCLQPFDVQVADAKRVETLYRLKKDPNVKRF
jgi:hypothetical protein